MPRPKGYYLAMLKARKELSALSKEQRTILSLLRKAARTGQPASVTLTFSGPESKAESKPVPLAKSGLGPQPRVPNTKGMTKEDRFRAEAAYWPALEGWKAKGGKYQGPIYEDESDNPNGKKE